MELSKRLQAVADMAETGSIVADVGCDHGYVSMYLIRSGICPHVLAMDVNRGPLERAAEHVEQAGLSAYIDLRLSDGLKAMGWKASEESGNHAGDAGAESSVLLPEADTLLTAGLGGRLAVRILEDSADKVQRMKWAILQPQSEIWLVRQKLRKLGYSITDENMIFEEGKYYTVIKARNERWVDGEWQKFPMKQLSGDGAYRDFAAETEQVIKEACPVGLKMAPEDWLETADRFGLPLILKQHPALKEYLIDTLTKNQSIMSKIQEEMQVFRTGQRLGALERENDILRTLIDWM